MFLRFLYFHLNKTEIRINRDLGKRIITEKRKRIPSFDGKALQTTKSTAEIRHRIWNEANELISLNANKTGKNSSTQRFKEREKKKKKTSSFGEMGFMRGEKTTPKFKILLIL